jgi:16S rRNA (cytosine967-C5)-methyltransferase
MKQWSYVNTAVQLINDYHGQEPFASFIKKYFAQHKKYGSRDRREISHLCYCYFRLGKSPWNVSAEEKISIALFFCSHQSNDILALLKPEWNDRVHLPVSEKYSMITGQPVQIPVVFPWRSALSDGIGFDEFNASFFNQPDLFLRLRPGKESLVQEKLSKAGIAFRPLRKDMLALPSAARLDDIVGMNQEAVVQDYNSQNTGALMREALESLNAQTPKPVQVWDCCAASGGKSIMAYDIDPSIKLTVSDIRESILVNLRKRMVQAGIRNYQSFVADLSGHMILQSGTYDMIICDAPCTGSGTWGRTPEQLYFFDDGKIEKYASLQQKILGNVIPRLNKGGYLLYITCSVFRKENEEAVDYITRDAGLELIRSTVLKGYEVKADTMFAALFRKS